MGAVTNTVTTDASGNYTDVITGDDTGNWRVGAQFAGDGTRAPSASPLCTFMVGSNN